jgi:hypothetical protein
MLSAELLATLPCAPVFLDLLEIHSLNANLCESQLLSNPDHAFLHHAELMPSAGSRMVLVLVLVYPNTLEIHTKDADLNVLSALIVLQTRHACLASVGILVLELVDKMLSARL